MGVRDHPLPFRGGSIVGMTEGRIEFAAPRTEPKKGAWKTVWFWDFAGPDYYRRMRLKEEVASMDTYVFGDAPDKSGILTFRPTGLKHMGKEIWAPVSFQLKQAGGIITKVEPEVPMPPITDTD